MQVFKRERRELRREWIEKWNGKFEWMKTRNSKKRKRLRNIVIIGKTSNEERKYHRRAEDKRKVSVV